MKNQALMKALLVALAVAAACSGCVLPRELKEEGVVCRADEYSSSAEHEHNSTLARWKILAYYTRLKADNDLPRWFRVFMKVVDEDPTELQNVDIYVLNKGKPPLSKPFPYGCHPTAVNNLHAEIRASEIGDFVFAAGIHQIENNDPTKPKSPHLILYIPLHTQDKGGPNSVQEFRMMFMHMEETKRDCERYGTDLEMKDRCEVLVELRHNWKPDEQWSQDFKDQVAAGIDTILIPEYRLRYHNGVIHGTS